MNFYFVVALALALPTCYLARETGQRDVSASNTDKLVFPKDRKSNSNTRIIGGSEVTPHSYPFQVALLIYTSDSIYFCGGTLIKPDWVLTAAHCVDVNPKYILVELGAHDISEIETNSLVLNSTHWVHHENWNENTLQNDVGLVKLPRNVTTNEYIQTVSYATGNNRYEGVNSTVIGWGQTEYTTSISDVLMEVNATIISNDACAASADALSQVLISSHLCISGAGIKGSCSGDSGGPLLVDGVQVGIVSFGFENCELGLPSVFTRVTDFSDWITEHAVDGSSSYENLHYSLIVSVILTLVHLFKGE